MKRVIALVFLALLMINCSKNQVVVGSNNIIIQEKQLSVYDRIEVSGSYDVIFTDGEVGKIRIKNSRNRWGGFSHGKSLRLSLLLCGKHARSFGKGNL